MKYLFLLVYAVFVFLMGREVYRLVAGKHGKEAIVGLFMVFTIVPDFMLFDAYGIPGSFVFVFLFMCLIPIAGIITSGTIRLKFPGQDGLFFGMLFILLLFALYTKFVLGVTTDFYGKKLFGYVYNFLIPFLLIRYYQGWIIRSYDKWKMVLLYAILAYAFKNFSLVGILGFRETYMANYEDLKNVIFAAQVLAIGVIMCVYDLFRKYDFKTTVYLGILLVQILLFESRGPLLAAIGAVAILWWFRPKKNRVVKRVKSNQLLGISMFLVVIVAGFMAMLTSGQLERIVSKLAMFSSGQVKETRAMLYPITLQAISQNMPFGVGFGNSKIALMRINSFFNNDYPHNLVLELILEEGIFLAVPIFLFFIKWMKSIFVKDRYSMNTLFFFALYAFAFVCSMVSGDLVGSRQVFVFGYLAYRSTVYLNSRSMLDLLKQRVRREV